MADGANLELNISASQDASVHQTFTALTKLLEKLNKRLGSLNSSIEKLVGDNTKLKKSNDAVTASVDKTTASIDKQSAVSEKAAKKAEKDAERIAKAKEKEADRIAKAKEREAKRLAKEAERAEREADRLLEKERRRRDQEIKQQERDADRLAKLEAKNKRDLIKNNYGDPVTSKTYMTNQHDTFNMMDMYHRKLEQINREDERGTKIHGDKLIALQRTEDAFQKLLRPIDEAVKRKTAITDTLEKLMEFRNTNPESVSPQLNSHIDNLLSKVDKLGSVVNRQAFWEIADSFDFNRVFEKNLKTVQNSRIFTETEKHIQELGKFGSHTIDIYKNITKNMEDGSQQRAIAFRDVKQFGKWVEDNINTMSANIATLYSAESPDYARIEELKARKDAFEDMAKSIGKSQQTFDKFRSSFKDDLLPVTSVQKHTDELVSKHGEQAKTLFNFLNEGLDENSKRIKQNANAVTKYFTDVEKEKAKIEADLREKLTERASAKGEDQIKALDKGIDTLRHRVAELQHSLSDEGVIEAFLGKKSGRTAAFKSLNELMGSIPMFKKRIDEIRNSTEHGSVEQREAINKLKKDFTEYNKVLGTTSQLTAIASSNLEHLKRNNAAEDTIKKHQTVLRELEGIRKNLTNTFSGVSDFGASTNISNLLKRFSGILTSDSSFGEQARGLFADVDVKKLGSLEVELKKLHTQYNNVVPTIAKFAEVNGLSAEQVAKLNSAEFIQQAALQKTKEGVRKLAEEYLGFHKTSRVSLTLFDRMAASMGNMARYAFGASIYYAFENAIFSTIDAVAQFDQSLKNLQAITDATDKEVELLGDEIKRVAVETKYSLKDVAEGATIIGQAGFSATETMSILGSTMQLAQGSMSTVAASADLLTTAIAAFNLNASDAAMVADNMAAAMNYSKLDIDKLRTTFNYVGPVAMDAGASLQEMSAVLMVLANNGMKASTIGTSLRNVFSQLQSPSAELRKAFKGNETELAKLADKSVPVVDKFRILNKQLGTTANLFKMFGLRAAGTVSILMKFPEQIQEMYNGLHTLGEAERMADKQMEGLANRMANFRASLEVFGVTITEKPSEGLSSLVGWATKAVHWLTELVDGPVGSSIATFAGFAGAIGATVVAGRLFAFMFNTTVTGAISAFGKASVWAVEKLMVLAAAMGSTTAASSGLVGTLAVFSKSNPVLAGLTAIAATITGIAVAYSLFSKEENVAYKQLQKELKERREQIGLLRTALKYNRELSDSGDSDTTRSRNNIYLASNFPDISSAIMATENREDTEAVLKDYLKKVEDDTIRLTRESMGNTASRIQRLKDERKRAVDWYNRGDTMVDTSLFADDVDPDELLDKAMDNAYRGEQFDKLFVTLSEQLQTSTVEFSNTFDYWVETAKSRTSEIVDTTKGIFDGLDEAGRAEKLVGLFADSLDKIIQDGNAFGEAGDKIVNTLRAVAVASFELQHNVSVSGQALGSLSAAMNEMGLKGNAIVSLYSEMGDKHMSRLLKFVRKYLNEYNKIIKQGLPKDEQEKQLAALRESANKDVISSITTISNTEIAWAELTRKKEVEAIEATTKARQEKARLIDEVNEKFYLQEQMMYADMLQHQLSMIEQLNNVKIDPKTFNLLINAEFGEIDPKLLELIKDTPALRDVLSKYWSSRSNYEKSVVGSGNVPFGKNAKDKYAVAKNEVDTRNIENDIAYETGAISYRQYVDAKIEADAKLLEARKSYLDNLRKDAKAADNEDKIKAEEKGIAELEQKQRLEAIKQRRDVEKQAIELTRDESLASIAEVDSELRRSDMNAMDRDEQLLANEETRIRVTLASMREEYALGGKKEEQDRLLLSIREKELELEENIVEQQRLAYENRKKYIEQEYKYGLVSKEEYQKYLQKQIDEGKIDPYEGQRKQWLESDDWTDGVKEGLARILDDTKSMNEWIAEGVANFRNEWHSAIDDFVDACWDGTKSAEEIFKDFATNILMDWQKRIIKMYSDQMFDELIQPFLKGQGLGNIFNTLGGGRPAQNVIDTTATETAPVAKYVDGQLVQSINATAQNIQTSINSATAATTASIEGMATQSTSLLTAMANGATDLWSFLGNGFSSLWDMIGSGMSNMIFMITSSLTSGAGSGSMSFWERWLTNSIGMGFKLFGSFSGGAQQTRVDANYQGMQAIGESGYNDLYDKMFPSAKGNVFKGLSDFSNSIVSSPTLFTYGEHLKAFAKGGVMGEAGPEAIMPLTRDGAGRLGVSAEGAIQPCINNIYIETPEGYTAEQTSRVANNNGGEDIMFTIVKQTAANVGQPGSPMYRAMQNTFGASQVLTSR